MVESKVRNTKTGEETTETRYFISSLPVDPKRAPEAIRSHWGVEAMHWILDMDFDEDRSRARTGNIAENLAMLRHVVMNVLRLDKSVFGGISELELLLVFDEVARLRLCRHGHSNTAVWCLCIHGCRESSSLTFAGQLTNRCQTP